MLRYQDIKLKVKDELSKMKPSDKLPSRTYLCKKLDTTRATLDKAIKELESEGYLVSKKGSGTYVTDLITDQIKYEGNWGVIIPNIMDDIYPGIVCGIEDAAQKYGASITLCNSNNDPNKQELYIKRLIQSGVSGFIIVPVVTNDMHENYRLYRQLKESNIPFVFCNRSVDGIDVPVVSSNSFYGGYIATRHLIEKGYRNIAFIARKKYRTTIERCHGYISALVENGMEVNHNNIILQCKESSEPSGYAEMIRILESGDKVDAVFCFNDKVARGVYKALNDMKISISKEIGLIGYDNEDFCEKTTPKLTSVSYKNIEIGGKAAEILWKMINNKPLPDFNYYLFQPEIVVRESCKGPGVD